MCGVAEGDRRTRDQCVIRCGAATEQPGSTVDVLCEHRLRHRIVSGVLLGRYQQLFIRIMLERQGSLQSGVLYAEMRLHAKSARE